MSGSSVDFLRRLRYGKPVMSDGLFYDPAVLKVMRAILVSKGIRAKQDLEDAIGEVVLACIEYVRDTGRPPEDVLGAIAIGPLPLEPAVALSFRSPSMGTRSAQGSTPRSGAMFDKIVQLAGNPYLTK